MEKEKTVGKYRILDTLGEGGEGRVYLAEDESLSRKVALKCIRQTEKTEEEIRREAAFLRDLRHPMLPVVYELFYEDDWYLAMEYIEGESLQCYIESRGRVEEAQGCLWADALLDVLCYLHTRKPPVIYRDLKPDNIMVCRDGTLKLVDFGGTALKSYGEKCVGRMVATAGYAAPEQWPEKGQNPRADERSDLYAFGKILYYMVTGADPGKPPYTALSIAHYDPLLSAGLERIIRRCMEEEPEARYQVAEEVRRDLQRRDLWKKKSIAGGFLRHVEKQVYLTQKVGVGL
ncbi:MAG: serine/threonine protein kinase [Lachnospiraceae bacterium]|nr:serine/threonine protein kinase [Lachnospiraceae bacterium]